MVNSHYMIYMPISWEYSWKYSFSCKDKEKYVIKKFFLEGMITQPSEPSAAAGLEWKLKSLKSI